MVNKTIHTDQLTKNMIITNNVYLDNGGILIPKNTLVTKEVKTLLTKHFIEFVTISTPIDLISNPDTLEIKNPPVDLKLQKEFQTFLEVAEKDLNHTLKDIVFQDKEVDTTRLLTVLNSSLQKTVSVSDLCTMLHSLKQKKSELFNILLMLL